MLIERRVELEVLERGLARALEGEGNSIVVAGPPGVGKTALLDALASGAEATDAQVLRARGDDLERQYGYGLARQLLGAAARPLFERSGQELAGPARLAARVFDADVDADVERLGAQSSDPLAILHGLYWLTVDLSEPSPVVMLVDDVHWADPGSLRFFNFLARRLEGIRLMLVVAARPAETPAGHEIVDRLLSAGAVLLQPRPLSESASATLVRSFVADADDEVCKACHIATGGNPLYLRELALSLADTSDTAAPRHPGAVTPDGIARSLRARLERLPTASVHLARATAVLGDAVPLRWAATVARLDIDAAAAAADALTGADILVDERPLTFSHPIVRQAVYQAIPLAERAAAHALAARVLHEEGASDERVAAQLLAGDPAGDPWTIERLVAAARQAQARGAPESAVTFFKRALEEGVPREQRHALMAELGIAEWHSGDVASSAEHLAAALQGADGEDRLQTALTYAGVLASTERAKEAIDVIDAERKRLGGGNRQLAARLDAHALNWSRMSTRARHGAAQRFERLRGCAQEDDPLIDVAIGAEMAMIGESAEASAALAQRALDHYTAHGWDWPAYFAIRSLIAADRLEAARVGVDARLDALGALGSPLDVATLLAFRAEIFWRVGDLAAAEADARSGLVIAAEHAPSVGLPTSAAALVLVLTEKGEFDEADGVVGEGPFALPGGDMPDDYQYTLLLFARGQLRAAENRPEEALDDLFACGSRLNDMGETNPALVGWRSAAAWASLLRGDQEAAERLATDELQRAQAFGAARALGIAQRAVGVVVGGKAGLPLLESAVHTLESSPAVLERARALCDLGSGLRRTGHRHEAREPLRRAVELAHRCGAKLLEDRGLGELRATGARPRRPFLSGVDALTPSERRISELAVSGKSNRQIAQALFVTVRTVEFHLGSAYRKLGIGSRSELATALAERVAEVGVQRDVS